MKPTIFLRIVRSVSVSLLIGFTLSSNVSLALAAEPQQKVYYFLHDHLGGINAVTDEEGNVVERRDYLPFGSDRLIPDAQYLDYGFTGKEQDPETELYYYGARYYDPFTGRFISPDPLLNALDTMNQEQLNAFLSDPQNLNTYSYVNNNPLKYTDSTGAYKDEDHYNLTYYIMLAAGFDDATASAIAWYNYRMDSDPNTAPVNSENVISGKTWYNHFAFPFLVVNRVKKAIESQNFEAFGQSLHPFQDVFGAHSDVNPITHPIFTGLELLFGIKTDPDQTQNDPKKAYRVFNQTFWLGAMFRAKQLGLDDEERKKFYEQMANKWNEISADVEEYIKAEDKSSTKIKKEIDRRNAD